MGDETLARLAAALGVAAPDRTETQLLLDCARDVAHTSERRHAPLAAFLVGAAVADQQGDRADAVADAVKRIREVLEPGAGEGPPAR